MRKLRENDDSGQGYPKIMTTDRRVKRDAEKTKKEMEKREVLAKKLEEAILQICLNTDYMSNIQDKSLTYLAANGIQRNGVVLIKGIILDCEATLAVEPVNSQVNIYLIIATGNTTIKLHWMVDKQSKHISPISGPELPHYLTKEEFVGKTTPRSLKRKHRVRLWKKVKARLQKIL